MNERIKELAKQAGECTNSVYTPPVRSKTPGKIWEDGHIDWHELYNEKFAELIVQDCKNIIRQEWFKENNSEVDRQDTRSIAIHVGKKLGIDASLNAVTKHFGVEYE